MSAHFRDLALFHCLLREIVKSSAVTGEAMPGLVVSGHGLPGRPAGWRGQLVVMESQCVIE